MKLYLFRHAAVEEAFKGCYNGHIDIPASDTGLLEAKENFKALKNIDFDLIYCSTLQRARQTLEAFEPEQDIIYTPKLREKSWGRHEGKSYNEVVEMEDKTYQNFKQWIDVLDGEDHESFIENIRLFLVEIAANSAENILLVTHAGIIYTLIHLVKSIALEEAFMMNISYGDYFYLEFKI